MKKIIFMIVVVLFAHIGTAQLITITTNDTEFERCLETLAAAQGQGNVAGDNEVILNNIASVTEITCTGAGGYGAIMNIEGVENFTSLQILSVWQTQVSDLSPSFGLTNMQEIRAFQSQVDGVLDFSAMPNLNTVGMDANGIDGILFNTGNSVLDIVDIRQNQLTEIQLPAAAPLTRLILSNNSLQCGVDISNLLDTLVHFAVCDNPDLEFVYVDQTDLPGIDGRRSAETCPQTVLNNAINGLLIDNTTTSFEAVQNDNCQACLNDLNFIDPALELFFRTQSNYDNGYIRNGATNLAITDLVRNNKVCQELVDQVTFLNISGSPNNFQGNPLQPGDTPDLGAPGESISSLGGLEAFTNLQYLYAHNNNITAVDLTSNSALIDFRGFDGNGGVGPLQSVDLRGLTNLEVVGLNNNVINSLLLENNTSLRILNFSNNQLSGDFDFSAFDTQLVVNGSLDLANNPGPFCIEVLDKANADTRVANGDWFVGTFDETIFQDTPCDAEPLATVTANDADAAENPVDNGQFTITLAEVNNTGLPITVFFTLSGTALEGTDYNNIGASVDIPDGSDTATVDVVPIDDLDIEGDETVILTIGGGAGYDPGTPGSATVTITDDDQEPLATVTANDADAAENPVDNGQFTITLAEVNNTGLPITVFFTLSGTALEGTDYNNIGASVDIPDGSDTATVDVVPIDDLDIEGDETVILTIGGGAGYDPGTPGSATVTITDDDQEPLATVTANDADAAENPVDNGQFTITLAEVNNTGLPITVFFTLSGTALEGTDYNNIGASVDIPDGSDTATVDVVPIDDLDIEGDETVILTIGGGAGYDPGTPGSATVTITDDDQEPLATVTANDADAAENPVDNGQFTITLAEVNNTGLPITVFFTLSGTALEGTDYNNIGASVDIPDGSDTATVDVVPIDDLDIEGDETVILTIDGGAGYDPGTPGSATVTITDDDQEPLATVTANDADAAENPVDNGQFTITLAEVNNTGLPITVFFTLSGTALEGTDYNNIGASVDIPDGSDTATVDVVPIDDLDIEGDETVILTIGGGAGYDPGTPNNAIVSIADDDTNQDNTLPDVNENTFSVTILENSCPNSANGQIQVGIGSTTEQFNLTFNGAAQGTLAQGQSRIFDLLPAGQYRIELAIPAKNWVQEFTLALEQAELIQAKSVLLDEQSESLRMEVVGSESYSVGVNGSEYVFDGFLSEIPALLQIPLEKGRNQVTVRGSKECQGTIEQNVVLNAVLVHPIPSREWLYIEGLPQDGPIRLQIFDLSGKKILEQLSSERTITKTIDVSRIPSGQYILDVSGDRVQKTLQFIKI